MSDCSRPNGRDVFPETTAFLLPFLPKSLYCLHNSVMFTQSLLILPEASLSAKPGAVHKAC
ncbi:MAG: hypothetical protein IJS39_14975 [Synergistaceae bacterium]|nr:hypothetical protein [Synergistaceae bacterium]